MFPPKEIWRDGLPGSPGSREVLVFVQRPELRKLRVVVDADLLERLDASTDDEAESLLGSLLHHTFVNLLRYADSGPSGEEIAAGATDWPGGVNGWVIGPPAIPAPGASHRLAVTVAIDGSGSMIACDFGGVHHAAADESTNAYEECRAEEAAAKRAMDVMAASCAYAVGADLFISQRAYLFEAGWDAAVGVLAVRPLDALPLIGLYLRAQEQFTVRQSYPGHPGGLNMNRGGFYTAATYDLLPGFARWYGACEAQSKAMDDDGLEFLAGSAVHRFQRALQARDRIWFALNRPTIGDSGEDALDALDDVLLRLMGAVDVTARVARIVLELGESTRRQGWTNRSFREAVSAIEPSLAALFDPGTDHRLTLDVLARLRNTIHHAALPEIRVVEGRGKHETWVGVRADEKALVLAAADALGGRAAWGVTEPFSDEFHLDPGRLADQLVIHTAKLVAAVQAATPVERMSPGELRTHEPEPIHPFDGFGVDFFARIRLQLGLGTDSN